MKGGVDWFGIGTIKLSLTSNGIWASTYILNRIIYWHQSWHKSGHLHHWARSINWWPMIISILYFALTLILSLFGLDSLLEHQDFTEKSCTIIFRPKWGNLSVKWSHSEFYKTENAKRKFRLVPPLKKAFDRVPRKVLWCAMRKIGLEEWIVRLVQALYDGTKSI